MSSSTSSMSSSTSTTTTSTPAKRVGYGPDLVFTDRNAPAKSAPSQASSSSASSTTTDQQNEVKELHAALVASEKSTDIPPNTPIVRGPDFNQGVTLNSLFAGFRYMGLQATNLALAVEEVNRMLRWRLSDEPIKIDATTGEAEEDFLDGILISPAQRSSIKCTIFLGYTSNMISSGVREVIRFLCQHSMIQCIVTTAGGIEEDFIKCHKPFYCEDWKSIKGADLRKRGINRIGPNIGVPNLNYCAFQEWVEPILDAMLAEQKKGKGELIWTPSTMIHRLGKEINNEESVYYWCWKNNIPVFCPAITDGSLGDMIYFHGINNPGLIVDIAGDIAKIMDLAMSAKKSGQIILGGGIVKHHICNANLMRNGADFSVYINTGTEYDGSDAGAPPDEAVSWGKIKAEAKPIKVWGDASLLFPLLVSQTFAQLPFSSSSSTSSSSTLVGSQPKQK